MVCCQELWCILSDFNISLEQSKNENSEAKICLCLQDMTSHTLFFVYRSILAHDLLLMESCSVSAIWVLFPKGAQTLYSQAAILQFSQSADFTLMCSPSVCVVILL